MAGIVGVYSKDNFARDLHLGLFYHQHRAQEYAGFGFYDGDNLRCVTHRGLVRSTFSLEDFKSKESFAGIGVVSGYRQPVSETSKSGEMIFALDGNLVNHDELKERILREGGSFSGYFNP